MNNFFVNKFFATFAFTTLLLGAHVNASEAFAKLTPFITQQAKAWVNDHAAPLTNEFQVSYLNLFALFATEQEQFRTCAKHMASIEELLPSYEAFNTNLIKVITKYVESVQKKISSKGELTEQEEQNLIEKLQVKLQELVIHINKICYQTLHKHVAAKNPKALTYIFDENGMIAAEKRTKALPATL